MILTSSKHRRTSSKFSFRPLSLMFSSTVMNICLFSKWVASVYGFVYWLCLCLEKANSCCRHAETLNSVAQQKEAGSLPWERVHKVRAWRGQGRALWFSKSKETTLCGPPRCLLLIVCSVQIVEPVQPQYNLYIHSRTYTSTHKGRVEDGIPAFILPHLLTSKHGLMGLKIN